MRSNLKTYCQGLVRGPDFHVSYILDGLYYLFVAISICYFNSTTKTTTNNANALLQYISTCVCACAMSSFRFQVMYNARRCSPI
jgi:hypothetical protein